MRFLPILFLMVSNLLHAAPLTVGVEYLDYYPAYNYIGKPSNASVSKDILDDFAKRYGHQFEYVPLPVNRLYEKFLDGSLDFKFPDHRLWQKDLKASAKIVYSDPVFDFIDGVLVRDHNAIKSVKDLKKIGSFRGFTVWDYQPNIAAGLIEVKYYDTFRELIMSGLRGSVDGVYLNIKVAEYYFEQIKKENPEMGTLTFQNSLPFTHSSYHLSTLRHQKIIDQFNRYLKEQKDFIKQVITDRKAGL
jgi:ABC-type amino acid transport substrate-binding protein